MVTYKLIDNEYIPAVVTVGEYSTPVWRQNRWDKGEFAEYIRKNGCGHCCTAMAANLHGVEITPYEEYENCRKMWGEPKEGKQYHYMSVTGIRKSLNSFGVTAQEYGVISEERLDDVKAHIIQSLSEGKQVIFWSDPTERFPENPFSKGEHYVLAAGFDENGKIVVLNSSERWTAEGIQLVDIDTIVRALRWDSDPQDTTWGEPGNHEHCSGYVVVG